MNLLAPIKLSLKPCPFCGCSMIVFRFSFLSVPAVARIMCLNCNAQIRDEFALSEDPYEVERRLEEAWNRRAVE